MKRIDTLIHPALWEQTRALFEALAVPVTLREVKTFGRTPPRREVYRGAAYYSNVAPELEVTAVVADEQLERVLAALEPLAHGGEILVSHLEARLHHAPTARPAALSQPAPASWALGSALLGH